MNLLPLRTCLTILTFMFSIIIYWWSRKTPALFIGLQAGTILLIRMGLIVGAFSHDSWHYEITLTLASFWLLLSVAYIAKSIWEQKQISNG